VPRYVLRFDDICPTMNWPMWTRVEETLIDQAVKPILAVIPNNQDPSLRVHPPRAGFWDCVRRWQSIGWTIGLHGYSHLYVGTDPGIVGKAPNTEFAGLPFEQQESKLRSAVDIFRSEGVNPDVWIAPSHSFDRNTVTIVSRLGIRVISDGFFLYPGLDENGVLWIPQQISSLRPRPFGVWSSCFHINRWTEEDFQSFESSVREQRSHITSVAELMVAYGDRRQSRLDRSFAPLWLWRIRSGSRLRGWLRLRSGGAA
jgi:hypothetical protein